MIKIVNAGELEKEEPCCLCGEKRVEKLEDGRWMCIDCIMELGANAIDGELEMCATCALCNKEKMIMVDRAAFNNWVSGMDPKEAFADTPKEDLSWIIYHLCPDCWMRCNMLTKINSTENGIKPL